MAHKSEMGLNDILLSLSLALDLVLTPSGLSVYRHSRKVCYIGLNLAELLGYREHQIHDLFLAALLHDAGLYYYKGAAKLRDIDMVGSWEHCEEGYHLLKRFSRFENISNIIRHHHDKWLGPNHSKLAGEEIPLASQIIFLSDRAEIMIKKKPHILAQRKDIVNNVVRLSGTFFKPELVELFRQMANRESFWLDLSAGPSEDVLRGYQPQQLVNITLEELKEIAQIFADIIDKKSKFTKEHSVGVSCIARGLAQRCGFSSYECEHMEIAGLLHDLGKLVVPEEVLDKPAKLTPRELCFIRSHTYHTYAVLDKLKGLELVRDWASFHHERLDGQGYPFHHDADTLSLGSRIMAVADHTQSLGEDRPYRRALPQETIITILKGQVQKGALDSNLVELVSRDYDDLVRARSA